MWCDERTQTIPFGSSGAGSGHATRTVPFLPSTLTMLPGKTKALEEPAAAAAALGSAEGGWKSGPGCTSPSPHCSFRIVSRDTTSPGAGSAEGEAWTARAVQEKASPAQRAGGMQGWCRE